jgi:DNA-binding response OmpR family regulator
VIPPAVHRRRHLNSKRRLVSDAKGASMADRTHQKLPKMARPVSTLKLQLDGGVLSYGPIRMNLIEGHVQVEGASVELQPKQFHTLAYLMSCASRDVPIGELIAHVFRTSQAASSSNVRRQIMELRRRLQTAGELIVTTRRGYGIGVEGSTCAEPKARDKAIPKR